MLGRVYTFERDVASGLSATPESVSKAAIDAVIAAIGDAPGIRYEELTDSDNAQPIIAMLFSDPQRMQRFDELVAATLKLSAIKVSVAHAPELPQIGMAFTPSASLA